MTELTEDQVIERLRWATTGRWGALRGFATEHGISTVWLWKTLHGHVRVTDRVAAAVGVVALTRNRGRSFVEVPGGEH